MEFIVCKPDGVEVCILKEHSYIDIDCGRKNDFEIRIKQKTYKEIGISYGWMIGVPETEYGGVINKIKSNTGDSYVTLSGDTWRGMLNKKIIEPPVGKDYLVVSGDANSIVNNLTCSEFDGLFVCDKNSGIVFENFQFDRYVTHLEGLEKMLLSKNARLEIKYNSGKPNDVSYVTLEAVPIQDFSDNIEYSSDGTLSFLSFIFEDFKGGINHLICLGKGELKDRLVIHLYEQEDGSIGTTKHYTGKEERTAVYDYSNSADEEELMEKGSERLKKLMSYKKMDMDLYNKTLAGLKGFNNDVSIGDIVGGKDFDTGIYLKKQITEKIITVKNNKETIEYKVGGNASSV